MAIGQQFSGLDMKNLIGAPLSAAADASVQLAHSTADFINTVGFDRDGKTRTAEFKFNQMGKNEDGSMENQEMSVDVPLLAIVPIPNLQIDEVNVLFDMEVKQSEMSESSSDYGGSFSGKANFGIFKVSVSGSVSAHSSNTRSSDNSAKYHVDVSATNHGTPEGLARVLDMMAANVAPTIASSTAVDESGKALTGERKARNDKIKSLRLKKSKLDSAYSSAERVFNSTVEAFKRDARSQQNGYTLIIQHKIESIINDKEKKEEVEAYEALNQKILESWRDVQNIAKDKIIAAAESASGDTEVHLTSIFVLEAPKEDATGAVTETESKKLVDADEANLKVMVESFKRAISKYQELLKVKKQLEDTDIEYNETIYNVSMS